MTQAQGNLGGVFDANQVSPQKAFEVIPTSWQSGMISDSSLKDTKDGTGKYLELVWEIVDGEYKGRKVYDRLNIMNKNPKAMEIAQSELSAICHATGQMQVQDSSQLHNIPCLIRVKAKPARTAKDKNTGQMTDYDASNEIKGYRRIDDPPRTMGTAAQAAAPSPAPAPQPAPAAAPQPAPAAAPPAAPPAVEPVPPATDGQPSWMK